MMPPEFPFHRFLNVFSSLIAGVAISASCALDRCIGREVGGGVDERVQVVDHVTGGGVIGGGVIGGHVYIRRLVFELTAASAVLFVHSLESVGLDCLPHGR
ncbi:hypothetical protein LSTR_LSTR009010 [Laodelphax striatellus]|uniref:Secreted protein n=1 Tax=Laodelphax striatellus TaxID=195883 RepID=A0A482WXG0_LAOST|nr:hypothetical protein LSTR_LSTR009010 [Laodelphax striatellus]